MAVLSPESLAQKLALGLYSLVIIITQAVLARRNVKSTLHMQYDDHNADGQCAY